MAQADLKPIPMPFPLKGIHESSAISAQPPGTSPNAQNVRGYDLAARCDRGCQRVGLVKYVPAEEGSDPIDMIVVGIIDGTFSPTGPDVTPPTFLLDEKFTYANGALETLSTGGPTPWKAFNTFSHIAPDMVVTSHTAAPLTVVFPNAFPTNVSAVYQGDLTKFDPTKDYTVTGTIMIQANAQPGHTDQFSVYMEKPNNTDGNASGGLFFAVRIDSSGNCVIVDPTFATTSIPALTLGVAHSFQVAMVGRVASINVDGITYESYVAAPASGNKNLYWAISRSQGQLVNISISEFKVQQ